MIADNPEGLLFKYKRDRKILNVDPKVFQSAFTLMCLFKFYRISTIIQKLLNIWLKFSKLEMKMYVET